jgi:xanthine dehydrogenase iron-sulfur cluster and FAD-binding subunit A
VQRAFIAHDGFQCGYCTPGQVVSAVGMLQEVEAGWPSHVTADVGAGQMSLTDEEVRERMSGNLCRCGAYANIVPAIRRAAQEGPGHEAIPLRARRGLSRQLGRHAADDLVELRGAYEDQAGVARIDPGTRLPDRHFITDGDNSAVVRHPRSADLGGRGRPALTGFGTQIRVDPCR